MTFINKINIIVIITITINIILHSFIAILSENESRLNKTKQNKMSKKIYKNKELTSTVAFKTVALFHFNNTSTANFGH
jgi:aromatic ring-opening dioxygenase LigB subunit